jgi:hypothetical protein
MNSARSNAPFGALGFPIRTPSDQRLVGNSPTLFAATHVLHRLLAPRHPPHALSSLLTQISRPPPPPPGGACRNSRPRSRPRALRPTDPLTATALHTCALPPVSPRGPRQRLEGVGETLETQGQGLENFCSQQKLNSTLRMHFSKSSCWTSTQSKNVELDGIEPTTSSLQSWRSPN